MCTNLNLCNKLQFSRRLTALISKYLLTDKELVCFLLAVGEFWVRARAVHTHRLRGLLLCFAADFRDIQKVHSDGKKLPWNWTANWELLDIFAARTHLTLFICKGFAKAYSWIATSRSELAVYGSAAHSSEAMSPKALPYITQYIYV